LGEVDSEGPATIPTQQDLTAQNGIMLANGLNLANGLTLANGATLANGLNLANGIQFANGLLLSNGLNLANGVVAPDGIAGPYVFPSYCASSTSLCVGSSCTAVASCTNSDLTKWIDSSPTNNLLILQYEIQCALPSTVTVRVNYRGTLYAWAGAANLGPDWQSGLMSSASQEAVSSCLLARVNASGQHLSIDMFGPMSGLNTSSSADAPYSFREAVVFGNLFLATPQAYLVPMGVDVSALNAHLGPCDTRACKTSANTCINSNNTCGLVSIPALSLSFGGNYIPSVTYNGTTWNYPITTYLSQLSNGAACTFNEECGSMVCASNKAVCSVCHSNADCPAGMACSSGQCGAQWCTKGYPCF
jgi:hypothetical protein